VAAAKVETHNRTRPAAFKAAKRADPFKSEHKPKMLLPKIVIHEPLWWDSWTDVHHPKTSYGEKLDVPAVNSHGKMYEDDLARYYPKDYSADQTVQRLRSMVRSGRRLAAARRRERARQGKAIPGIIFLPERSLATGPTTPRSRFSP
jgi:hypothetical protein